MVTMLLQSPHPSREPQRRSCVLLLTLNGHCCLSRSRVKAEGHIMRESSVGAQRGPLTRSGAMSRTVSSPSVFSMVSCAGP